MLRDKNAWNMQVLHLRHLGHKLILELIHFLGIRNVFDCKHFNGVQLVTGNWTYEAFAGC